MCIWWGVLGVALSCVGCRLPYLYVVRVQNKISWSAFADYSYSNYMYIFINIDIFKFLFTANLYKSSGSNTLSCSIAITNTLYIWNTLNSCPEYMCIHCYVRINLRIFYTQFPSSDCWTVSCSFACTYINIYTQPFDALARCALHRFVVENPSVRP